MQPKSRKSSTDQLGSPDKGGNRPMRHARPDQGDSTKQTTEACSPDQEGNITKQTAGGNRPRRQTFSRRQHKTCQEGSQIKEWAQSLSSFLLS